MNDSIFIQLGILKQHDHLCHIYYNETECHEIGANFFIHGIKRKEKCLYISGKILPKEFIYRITGSGIDLNKARKEKDFEEVVLGMHLEKIKDPSSYIRFLKLKIEAFLKDSKKISRILITNEDFSTSYNNADIAWQKASLDKICSEKPIILMNQYEIRKIGSEDLINIFKTHHKIILENVLFDSPFYVTPDMILSSLSTESNKYGTLTNKEKGILRHIVNGLSSKSIAKELSISVKTVETHRVRIMCKLDIHNIVDLVKFAMKNRIT